METEKSLVRTTETRLPKFVEDAYDTIEGMNQFAQMLLDSKLVPDHFYEKGADNKPDYTKGKKAAVVIVLLQAQQLAIPPMTALQHVIPVNGLLSIKGDLAKTMIFASGKLRKDSWKETVTGTIEEENMAVTITATREDNGLSLTRSFSVDKAKRMGLWITTAQVNSADGWKWKKSAWYKTPDRMIMYRCIGFIARDLFSDVLLNMYTTEEAMDIQRETTEVIETESGAKITIPDKEHSKARSTKMTDRVADKIPDNKFGKVNENIQEAEIVKEDSKNVPEEYTERNKIPVEERGTEGTMNVPDPPEKKEETPFIAEKGSVEFFDGKEVSRNDVLGKEGDLTLEVMEKMDSKDLLAIINADTDLIEAMSVIPGKNTNKKLRYIIDASQRGILAEYIASHPGDDIEQKQGIAPEEVKAGEIPINREFDKGTPTKNADILQPDKPKEVVIKNKYDIAIPEPNAEGKRDFATVKSLYNLTAGVTPSFNNARYLELAGKKGILAAFPDKEVFLRSATTKMICELLDMN